MTSTVTSAAVIPKVIKFGFPDYKVDKKVVIKYFLS